MAMTRFMDNISTAPNLTKPPLIYRKDYRPFGWKIANVHLDFALGLEHTQVTARLQVSPNPHADVEDTIRLNGDGLTALAVVVDGQERVDYVMEGDDLVLALTPGAHDIAITTAINPAANTQLMGLYASNGMLCTQCESEGFRRITFYPDRPDVLSVFTVKMHGAKAVFPVLLSNGNMTEYGELEGGDHYAIWHDPWPKPSYLFALVAGDLAAKSGSFTTMSGRKVALNIWVREEDLPRTDHALESLIKSMQWDEKVFGREYDLDLFNIVAVSDFNMGAMENKGLNVFNTKYVLADPETATDGDYDGIEGVIAHEYFHNWSGNRITCRDWFQLSLKEGFTVLRDQLFSQDCQGEAVKRIEDVRVLRAAQFPEDSGPLAHPIRPDSFREISNFYTATIYNKGAEVIRMMRTMAGAERFRKGCDLYFERHDGEAATCEDFIKAIEDGAGLDLGQFRLWYSQAGTPKITIASEFDGATTTLTLRQEVPATPGQANKQPMPIPLKIALFDRKTGMHRGEHLLVLDKTEDRFSFNGFDAPPILSINRGFSAPVNITREVPSEDLVFLAAKDDDAFARYEAMQELLLRHIIAEASGALSSSTITAERAAIGEAYCAILGDASIDDSMRGELMSMPSPAYLAEQMAQADPGKIHAAREGLKAWLGTSHNEALHALYARVDAASSGMSQQARGARKVKGVILPLLAASDAGRAAAMAARQYDAAHTMTDRQSALAVLCGIECPERAEKLGDFYNRFAGNDLVIDKWFSLQAMSLHPDVTAHVKALAEHADFNIRNPNRARALFMGFAANANAYHQKSGEGYRLIADFILALDPINAQTAARFVPVLGRWRRLEPVRSALMRAELERISKAENLSRDCFEQVSRSLD